MLLSISNLCVATDEKKILAGLSLAIEPGTVHALMGPNGSGKSTLAHTLMGHPEYRVESGTITYRDEDMLALPLEHRAQRGIFVAYQHPVEVPGVTVFDFLREAHRAVTKQSMATAEFQAHLYGLLDRVGLAHSFAYRSLNVGFSGGEKKRLEIVQLLLLRPAVAILDEIDSGLDIDAIDVVIDALKSARAENPELSLLIISHYPQLFTRLIPDQVHIIKQGAIVQSGAADLAHAIEQRGYGE